MAIDPYVPASRDARPRRKTQLPPAKPWRPDRPGDVTTEHTEGGAFGYQGPDQGYALRLANLFRDQVRLGPGERWDDVEYGVVGIAMRRASEFGRAPIKDDLEIGFLAWGFLPDGVPQAVIDDLVERRKAAFADLLHNHLAHRRLAESVPGDVLRLTPGEVRSRMASGAAVVA